MKNWINDTIHKQLHRSISLTMPEYEPLVNVSAIDILVSMAPLAAIAVISFLLGLDIESSIVVSSIRTFVQLSILAFILDPIFTRGVDLWWLVVGYCFLMILLAAFEGSTRSKYYVEGQFWMVLYPMFLNVFAVATFAFFVVIKPEPRWGKYYWVAIDDTLVDCLPDLSHLVSFFLAFRSSIRHTSCRNAPGKLHQWNIACAELFIHIDCGLFVRGRAIAKLWRQQK